MSEMRFAAFAGEIKAMQAKWEDVDVRLAAFTENINSMRAELAVFVGKQPEDAKVVTLKPKAKGKASIEGDDAA